MTDIDTSAAAVEKLARDHEEVGNNPDRYIMGHPHHFKTAAMLRALRAENERLREALIGLDDHINNTDYATHYHTPAVAPAWASTMPLDGHIGGHLFYTWE